MAVADFGGADHRGCDVFSGESIGAECPKADGRHFGARPKDALGNEARVDAVLGYDQRRLLDLAQRLVSL
jgi:hypothetical protein